MSNDSKDSSLKYQTCY